MVKTYYLKYYNNKIKDISIKDYYVLLYYSELLGVIEYTKIIEKAQRILHILPKIYYGDHITILNACFNIAIISNNCNIVLYRSKSKDKINNIFASGYLRYQYLLTNNDI